MPFFSPDLLLINGRFQTMEPAAPTVSAIAIHAGRIIAIGENDEIRSLAGSHSRIEDLDGTTVIPGLIDAHNHLLGTGQMLSQVQLYDCRSLAAIQARIAERARTTPSGDWIVGRGWDESLLTEGRHPTRHDLDAAVPDRPVVLHRVWNKLACNSAALRIAGITAASPDPPSSTAYAGSFDRDESGAPTGLFRDRAKSLIVDAIPPASEASLVEAIATACHAYNAVGITSVAEPGLFPAQIRAFHQARRDAVLTVRTEMLLGAWGFGVATDEAALLERFTQLGFMGGFGDDLLRLEGIKLMPDGGISDRTARVYEPYLDEPDNRGTWVVDPERLPRLIRAVHDLGWPMDIHTCGDEAQEVTVRAFAAAQTASPKPWLRHRVHHAYFPTAETLRLMADHRIPALVSAPFLTNLGEGFVNAVGAARAARAMPMRTYLSAGIPLAATSDSPITDFNPFVGMHATVARSTITGRQLEPSEGLTAFEALHAYTVGGADATGQAANKGSISPGKLADLVVLDADPLTVATDDLPAIKPIATILGGAWVFDRR